ncbi:MAG: glycosyltransferase [Thermoanaerobaculia bacterium]
MTALNACTIVAKNYLPFARVLARSFLEHHPDGRFFVLLIDRGEDLVRPEDESFTLVEVEELDNVPDLDAFLFKYTILESSTAIKPYFIEHLFRRFELPNLCYVDPDILVLRPLEEVSRRLDPGSDDRTSIVLTPHLDEPMPDDGAHPSELTILQAGSYNLGFLGLRWTPVTERLLTWWQERLYDQCLVRIDQGLFVDQKWMDIVPGIFEDFHLLLHPGYNVAYWNLHGRELTRTGDDDANGDSYLAKGEPLVFFHFSGIDPHHLDLVSKYQNRFVFSDLGLACDLYRHYRDLLLAAGFDDCRHWPYAYGKLDNGVAIPDAARELYLSLELARRRRFGNPFITADAGSYWQWMNGPVDGGRPKPPYLTRLQKHLWSSRPDLQESYPDVEGKDFTCFCSWLLDTGRFEFGLDDAYLDTVHRESRATLWTAGGLKRRLKNRWQRFDHSETGKQLKRMVKRALGHKRSKAVRRRLRAGRPVVTADAVTEARRHRLRAPQKLDRLGVNLVGYLDAETGMGEAARSLARSFATTDVPVSLHSIDLNVLARREDPTLSMTPASPAESHFPYDFNLFVVNADQVGQVYEHLGAEVFGGRYNVGLWLWELEVFPDAFRGAFDVLHEIWTPSTFCADAISQVSPIPVRRVPLPVEPVVEEEFDRDHFGLPAEAFVVFFMFNYLSHFERKNPLAVVEAFKRACPDDDALLVLKTAHSDFAPEASRALAEACRGSNVRILDEYLSRDEIRALTRLCDAYVSLHRSEGFGLTLAEAMYYGKPVIATPYSGVTDFFNLNNGFPVQYELVELGDGEGPYPAGARWAQPSVSDAADQLEFLYRDPLLRESFGGRAQADVRAELSLEAVGRRLTRLFRGIVRETARKSVRRPSPT